MVNIQLNKVYFVIDKTGKCTVNLDSLTDFYSNKTPSVYRHRITNLKRYYSPEVFKTLLLSMFDHTEKEVRDAWVKTLRDSITKYLELANANFEQNAPLGIKWIIGDNGPNPLGPTPKLVTEWYGSFYTPTI